MEGIACGETADRCRRRLLVDEALFTIGILFQLQAMQVAARLATFVDEMRLQKLDVAPSDHRTSRVPLRVDTHLPPSVPETGTRVTQL